LVLSCSWRTYDLEKGIVQGLDKVTENVIFLIPKDSKANNITYHILPAAT